MNDSAKPPAVTFAAAVSHNGKRQIRQKAAEDIGPFVLQLIERDKDALAKPADLVKLAEPKNSTIHGWFEWRNEVAAEKHRLWQARMYIKNIRIARVTRHDERQPEPMRLNNVVVRYNGHAARGYVTDEQLERNPDWKKQVIADAHQRLSHWFAVYGHYKSIPEFKKKFSRVLREIEKIA